MRDGRSHEPKQQFSSVVRIFHQPSHATEIFIKVTVGLPCSHLHLQVDFPCSLAGECWKQVRHFSVSTVAFKFQAHHLLHIFKFVRDFGFGTIDKFSEVLVEF